MERLHIWEGRSIRAGDRQLEAPAPLTGRVRSVQRREAGDAIDALVTDIELPVDGSLVGKTVMVNMADEIVWSYRILDVTREGDQSVIVVEHEPGFEIRDNGRLIKMVFFPGWGLHGACEFRIVVPAEWER